jgi:hypothetical protein
VGEDRISLIGRIEALPACDPQRDPIDDQRPWERAFADAILAHQAHRDDLNAERHRCGTGRASQRDHGVTAPFASGPLVAHNILSGIS